MVDEIGPFDSHADARASAASVVAELVAGGSVVVSILYRDSSGKNIGEKFGEVYAAIVSKG